MNYVIILIILACGYKIYINKGQVRFDWFICSMLIFSSAIIIINKPQMPCHRFFIICYWLSVLVNHEYKNKRFPLKIPLAIYLIGILIIGINSEYLSVFYKVYKPIVLFLDTYLILLLAYTGVVNESFNSKRIVNTLLFVTLYGVVTFIIRSNPIQDIVTSAFGIEWREGYFFGERTRICSTWNHPIAYGFICGIFFYEYISYWRQNKIKLLLVLLVINVFLCGSRTALAAFFIMTAVIILMRYKVSKSLRVGFCFAVVAVLLYHFVPFVQTKVDSMVLTAMGEDTVEGSSLDMRENQTEAAMFITMEKPVIGHGIDYIGEEMGYGTDNFSGDSRLLGFESYAYIILIERGFLGLILELYILCSIMVYAIKNRKANKIESSYILAATLGFMFFSLATGTLDTMIPALFFTGVSISRISKIEINV